jgi:hypothetical protein
VDAVYINGGGWDAAPAIDYLERDLKIKVVWALAAEMWLTYHILKIENPVPGGGVLLTATTRRGRLPKKSHRLRCAQSPRVNVRTEYASAGRIFARLASEVFLSNQPGEFFSAWTKGGLTDEPNRLGENLCENGRADCGEIRATAEGGANRQASASGKPTSKKFLSESVLFHAMAKEI